MAKTKITISVDDDTAQRLKQYAADYHTTVSQAVTDWIWTEYSPTPQQPHPPDILVTIPKSALPTA